MKLRTRNRTASAAPDGMVSCELCRRFVPPGDDGRCVLGHRLPAGARVAVEAPAPAGHGAHEPDPVLGGVAGEATRVLEDATLEDATLEDATVPADAPVAPAAESAVGGLGYLDQLSDLAGGVAPQPAAAAVDPHHHPYDDVLAWEAGEPAPDASPDPLSWLEQVGGATSDHPAQGAPAPEPQKREILTDWQAMLGEDPVAPDEPVQDAAAAVAAEEPLVGVSAGTDVARAEAAETPAPESGLSDVESGEATTDLPGEGEAGAAAAEAEADDAAAEAAEAAWKAMLAGEHADEAEDVRRTRRHRLAVIAGGAIFGVLTLGTAALALVS